MKTIAFVCPWYGDNIPGGAEAALRGITSHLHDAGLPVEILTTTVEQFTADWNKDFYPEGVTKNAFGVDVRRFKIRKRDVKAFDSVNYKLMNGIRLTDKDEEVFNREMINSPAMYDYIRDNKDNYQCFVYIPYLFGTTYNGVAACPEKSVLIPCFHDEGYAHMNSFARMYSRAAGMLFNAQPELTLTKSLMDLSNVRTEVMGLGVDTAIRGSAEDFHKKFGISEPFILYAGRKDAGKNVDTLLDYFARYKANAKEYVNVYGVHVEDYLKERQESEPEVRYVDDVDYKEHNNEGGRYDIDNILGIPVETAKADANYYVFFPKYHNEDNLKLVLMGKAVCEIPKHPDIISLGFVTDEDKFDGISGAKALILPSKFESLSISVLEAMTLSKPVIVNGICDVLKGHCVKSNGGLYYKNFFEFEGCVNYLLEHTDVYEIMCKNARKYVEDYFQWEDIMKKFDDIIKLVGEKNEAENK